VFVSGGSYDDPVRFRERVFDQIPFGTFAWEKTTQQSSRFSSDGVRSAE
jgi:hypothetical protein